MNALILLDRAARALARCNVDKAKSIRDKAQALEVYARQAKQSASLERQCATIRLRAERRIGQLLSGMVKPGNPQWSHAATIGLRKLGITKSQSSRWQTAATLPEKEFERYLATGQDLSTAALLKLVTAKRQPTMGARSGGSILTGDVTRLFDYVDNDTVDLILTDPPYDRIDLYEQLGELAAAKLKPGCLCLAYCGQYHLPAVLEAMGRHLDYHWTFAIHFGGPHRAVYAKKIANTWHPLVAFSKGRSAAGWIMDMLESGGKEKDAHNYQKTLTDVEYIVAKLTMPGALVVDPYCGSGTVPAACKRLGRRWLACEIDSSTARVARGRLAA
jgi:hypothetical protein